MLGRPSTGGSIALRVVADQPAESDRAALKAAVRPNVLFELGMRMHADLPVALVRARGTGAIFDVDNMLRVEEYSPNLWSSSIDSDLPVLTEHIKAAWELAILRLPS
jgi:hypothetical protein